MWSELLNALEINRLATNASTVSARCLAISVGVILEANLQGNEYTQLQRLPTRGLISDVFCLRGRLD